MGVGVVILSEGDLIKSDIFDGLGEVKKFEERSGYFLLEVVLRKDNQFKPFRISKEQLEQIEIVSEELSFFDDAQDFFLMIEALRIRLAYQFDPLLAVNVSQIDPLPHQIDGVYDYALKSPKVRFLIGDDAGAGKTIMAGLVIKELQYRNMADRILIVVPGHLKYQWQRELKEKFNSSFVFVDRSMMDAYWSENVWEERNQVITTIDFLKQSDVLRTISSSQWDLVVVDEAHKLSAWAYGDKIQKTKRYLAGEVLSDLSTHMLFLTATPHRGNEENFRLFLDLLRPGFFSKIELLEESIQRRENPLFVRRLKEDMKDFKGNKLFPPRHIRTVEFRLTEEEKDLYYSVTQYVRYYFNRAQKKRNISFAMMVLQRRLTSSIDSILESLKRRKERMEELLELPGKIRERQLEYEEIKDITEEELEDMEEERRWEIEEKLTNLTIAENLDDVKKEISQLVDLIGKAELVKQKEIESKLVSLRDKVLTNLGDNKLLIFTQFKDTLDYLTSKLRKWGYSVCTIHGSMRMPDRITAEKEFQHESQIMVATEAAGEGINLQFCSWMVNYDIPWNPNRLEQRMGRIHRYGQKKEVFIWNMVSGDTIEGRILHRLFSKMESMAIALGSDKVFDVIGRVLPETDFEQFFKDAIFNQRRIEEIYEYMDKLDEEQVQTTLERFFKTGLATRHIDYTGLLRKSNEADENRLVPEYIQDYFLRAFDKIGGRAHKIRNYWRIDFIPLLLRQFNDNYSFKTRYGKIERLYSRTTFYKEIARENREYEYIAPGHPLLEAVNEKILDENFKGQRYAVFEDEHGGKHGVQWFFEGEVLDGAGNSAGKRMFCVYQDVNGGLQEINSSILWDLKPMPPDKIDKECEALLKHKNDIEEYTVNEILFPYKTKIEEIRLRESQIKKRYGLRSLDYLIQESAHRLLEYQQKQEENYDMSMPILNETRRKDRLEQKRQDLEKEIRLEKNITITEPRILGAAIVIPPSRKAEPKPMFSSKEVEQAGMEVAIGFETQTGWIPQNVSDDNLGFDIRSTKYDVNGVFQAIRYIEVKARARSGAVHISANEWKKAKRFGENYWLYIITYAKTDSSKLTRIKNPADQFMINEDIYSTGYMIPEENWTKFEGKDEKN